MDWSTSRSPVIRADAIVPGGAADEHVEAIVIEARVQPMPDQAYAHDHLLVIAGAALRQVLERPCSLSIRFALRARLLAHVAAGRLLDDPGVAV